MSWRVRNYAAYLFDLDGTLIDTAPDLNAALNRVLHKSGHPQVDETLTRQCVGHGARAMIISALQHLHVDPVEQDIDAMFAAFIEYYAANIADHSKLYDHVLDTLVALRDQGAKLAVVTNKPEQLSRTLLAQLDLTRLFDSIIGGDTAPAPKPDPHPVHLALTSAGVAAREALFVGDSRTDVDAARAAGMDVVCVPYGYNHRITPEALGADAVIADFRGFLPG